MPQKYEPTYEATCYSSKGQYRVRDCSGRWSSWKPVNGGLQEAMEAGEKAARDLKKKGKK